MNAMQFESLVSEYITGTKFSSSLKVRISSKSNLVISRVQYLEQLVAGKKIIHLGCTDHKDLIVKKIKANQWLHKRLCNSALRCLGIDINVESVRYVKDNLGYNDILIYDIESSTICEDIINESWDYMVIGEILEHVDNPVSFLNNIKEKYSKYIDKVVITVPNVFNLDNIKQLTKNTEFINSDHRYWFSPYTLAKVMHQAGLKMDFFELCQSYPIPSHRILHKLILKNFPIVRNTIIMVGNLK